MRILGVDYGEKRVGLAVSDESQTLARELEIVSLQEFWQDINQIIRDNQISEIILGWPLNLSGGETKKTKEVEKFKTKLETVGNIPVVIFDERLSSVMAKKLPGGNSKVDSLAAQILLQNYLNRGKARSPSQNDAGI